MILINLGIAVVVVAMCVGIWMMLNWVERRFGGRAGVVVALVIAVFGVLSLLAAGDADAQVPPTAAEMIDGMEYLTSSELAAVSDAVMARRAETGPLGVVATLAYWIHWAYGADWNDPPPLQLPDIPWADRLELFLRTEWGGGVLIGEYVTGEAYPVLELFVVGVRDSTLYSMHPSEYRVRVVAE